MVKSKTTTVTIDGNTLEQAMSNTINWVIDIKPKTVIQVTAYPVDDYWVVQITYKG